MSGSWRGKWQPTPVLLPGESHSQRSLAGYSPGITRVGHDLANTPPPPCLDLALSIGIEIGMRVDEYGHRYEYTYRHRYTYSRDIHIHRHIFCHGRESELTLGDSVRQGSLGCYSLWGRRESDMT